MEKYRFYIGIVIAALLLTACGKDNENLIDEDWKRKNEQAFNDLANNPEFTELKSLGNNGSVYYRVLQKGEGKRLFYNSRAEVYYKGWFVATNANNTIKAGDVFDRQLFDDGVTLKVAVSSQSVGDGYGRLDVYGWTIALQYMIEGDKWEIHIPYQLGYGERGERGIPGYTTLAFEIEVIKAIDPQ
jgi:peptidylprolyl isomerase/FKBP-type peptidyl-prolyl cis-trans isomerase FklB